MLFYNLRRYRDTRIFFTNLKKKKKITKLTYHQWSVGGFWPVSEAGDFYRAPGGTA